VAAPPRAHKRCAHGPPAALSPAVAPPQRWELWTFAEPFSELPLHALLHALSQPAGLQLPLPGDRDWDAAAGPEPAAGYEALLRRCWARDAAERPRACEIVFALEGMMSGLRRARAAAAQQAAQQQARPQPQEQQQERQQQQGGAAPAAAAE
jgi:hypothetical protein